MLPLAGIPFSSTINPERDSIFSFGANNVWLELSLTSGNLKMTCKFDDSNQVKKPSTKVVSPEQQYEEELEAISDSLKGQWRSLHMQLLHNPSRRTRLTGTRNQINEANIINFICNDVLSCIIL